MRFQSFQQKIERVTYTTLGLLLLVQIPSLAHAQTIKHETGTAKIDILAKDLSNPWGMHILPNGEILITERSGTLRLYDGKNLSSPIQNVPEVLAEGQGGLLDVTIDPNFASNNIIYFSYSEPGTGGAGTAVARAVLNDTTLEQVKVIFSQNKKTGTARHFGSRLTFAQDGTLYITIGDRGDADRAQDPFDHAGSLLRINTDGSIPGDNPFADGKKAAKEIYSLGHRNAQGADLHPITGNIWTVEHGARGGDEINQPEAGKNYGWPIISYGRHYSGLKIGIGKAADGYEQPLYYWDPSIAPSGMAFYDASLFKEWKGNLFVGALKSQTLVRLILDGEKIVDEERIFDGDYGRIRDIEVGAEGALYLLTDAEDGLLIKLTPEE